MSEVSTKTPRAILLKERADKGRAFVDGVRQALGLYDQGMITKGELQQDIARLFIQ